MIKSYCVYIFSLAVSDFKINVGTFINISLDFNSVILK